ncbi:MAG TPA: hypothetical protein VL172_21490 [Kofleriaceae bacterium]|nr:hypothetical protein [Kofleriaceae bacterium]
MPIPAQPRLSQEQRIAEWNDALKKATGEHTIPVLAEALQLPPDDEAPTRVRKLPPPPPGARRPPPPPRPDSEDGTLTPGMLVLGPPPATRGATAVDDDPEPTKPGPRR